MCCSVLMCWGEDFTHFEGRLCHPLDHTPSGHRLLAVNTPEGRLSVFHSVSPHNVPTLIAEIPVGIEPVTVRAVNDREAWVVNEVSDSISIIDLTKLQVIETIAVDDEPADVVFAKGMAFVSCARQNCIRVYDVATRAALGSIPVAGNFPRSLAVSANESMIHAAVLLSGNNTTALHFRQAPAQPAPWLADLPPPPQVALLVPDSDPQIPYDVIDHDIAHINVETQQIVSYTENIGTNIFSLSCGANGSLWVGAAEAKNLIRFEPNLNGIFSESRIARMTEEGTEIWNLNPHATAAQLSQENKSLSLAQPMSVQADEEGAWLAAFASDRIARIDSFGKITTRIDLRSTFPTQMRGPRGISIHPQTGHLLIYNKLSQTISLIHGKMHHVIAEFPWSSHQPISIAQQQGRGFFFDARLSGNGTVACGSCHLDADIDGIAWDLGDPVGRMSSITGFGIAIGEPQAVNRIMHPMKGPMVTQPLRGIKNSGPFHWRGDIATIKGFNSSFAKLQAGSELPAADMDKVVAYIESLRNHPNPNRLIDNTLPITLAGANPRRGQSHFHDAQVCSVCHEGARGTNHILDDFSAVLTRQPVKNSTLEHVYKKIHFTPWQATTLSGYGFTHDGTGHDIPRGHEYGQDVFSTIPHAEADVMAFLLCTETDTKPIVGKVSAMLSSVHQQQAQAGHCDVVAHAVIQGVATSFLYHPATNTYHPDSLDASALSPAQLEERSTSLRILAVPLGNGKRFSIDRNGDGVLNRDTPPPRLEIDEWLSPVKESHHLDWFIECSSSFSDWQIYQNHPEKPARQFFRLHRTW